MSHHRIAALASLALLAACTGRGEEVVLLSGVITEAEAEGAGDTAVAGLTVTTRDIDDAVVCKDPKAGTGCSSTTDSAGTFEVATPAAAPFFLELSGPEHVSTTFTGLAPIVDFEAAEGALWVRTPAQLEALRAEFAGTCPTASEEGAVIEGRVRLYISGTPLDELPIVTTARITAYDALGRSWSACYLPDEDEGEDPGDTGSPGDTGGTDTGAGSDTGAAGEELTPTRTGSTGRYAIFGLAEGPTTVTYTYQAGELTYDEVKLFRLPAAGVAPTWPALLPLPY